MNGRTDVVHESWQSKFAGANATTDDWTSFQHQHSELSLRETNRCRQPVRPRTHYHRVVRSSVRWLALRLTDYGAVPAGEVVGGLP